MNKIAIVEDDELDRSKLKTFIKQYEMNNPSFSFEIITLSNQLYLSTLIHLILI